MSTNAFDLDEFHTLQAFELHEYMEPLVACKDLRVSDREVNQLIDRLDEYDHYHLVYAIMMCSEFASKRFVGMLPRYLSHSEMSVRAAAMNLLRKLDTNLISRELVANVEKIASEQENDYLRTLASELEVHLKTN